MCETCLTIGDLAVGLVPAALGRTTRTPVGPGRRRRRARRRWAAGGGIRLVRRRARLVRIDRAGNGRLVNHSLAPLDQHHDMLERVDGWAHQLTRDHMPRPPYHPAARRHAHVGGSWSRFPRELIHELVCRYAWEKNSHINMTLAMRHGARDAAVTRGTMHRPMPRGAFASGRCPRRSTQDSDTARDQYVAHLASSRDSQASSTFLFDQRADLACKFNVNTLEKQVGLMAVATSTNTPAASDDLLLALHEEIARLPEKHRLAIVVCDLEGMTQAQAAGQLHWSERTLRDRLARGRARLKGRLARRGLAPDGATLGAVFLHEARAAVPPAWCESTVRAAVAAVNQAAAAGAVSTAAFKLTQEVLKMMLVQKLKLASAALINVGVTAWVASAAPGTRKGEQGANAVAPVMLSGSPALVHRSPIQGGQEPVAQVMLPYSADVASKKNDLLDALVQLELDQKILDRVEENLAAVPEVFTRSAERAVQGGRDAVNRALNNLKLWEIPQDEIDAIHAEAKKISADKEAWYKTPEGRWVKGKKQAAGAEPDPAKNTEKDDPRGRVTLRAPFDGTVIERNVHKDEMVVDNTVNLFQIADLSTLMVIANCPADLLPSLQALRGNERRWSVRTVGADRPRASPERSTRSANSSTPINTRRSSRDMSITPGSGFGPDSTSPRQ